MMLFYCRQRSLYNIFILKSILYLGGIYLDKTREVLINRFQNQELNGFSFAGSLSESILNDLMLYGNMNMDSNYFNDIKKELTQQCLISYLPSDISNKLHFNLYINRHLNKGIVTMDCEDLKVIGLSKDEALQWINKILKSMEENIFRPLEVYYLVKLSGAQLRVALDRL